jgi:hypothetical protein
VENLSRPRNAASNPPAQQWVLASDYFLLPQVPIIEGSGQLVGKPECEVAELHVSA